jgi:hypothetical protein
VGTVISARIHWPRASQRGLMHCTVKPGKYCICAPSVAAKLRSISLRPFDGGNEKSSELPLAAKPLAKISLGKSLRKKAQGKPLGKILRAGNVMAGIVPRAACGVKRKGYKILW